MKSSYGSCLMPEQTQWFCRKRTADLYAAVIALYVEQKILGCTRSALESVYF
jgi:hypothetical protein